MACVFLVATGCGKAREAGHPEARRRAARPGGSAPGSGDQPSGGSTAERAPHCGEPGDVVMLLSVDDLFSHMIGTWLYCSGWQIFAVPHDGIEIAEDGAWHFIMRDASGALVRQKGFDGGGSWSLVSDYVATEELVATAD